MAPPVVRVALALDQAALLELVEDADELAAVVAEDVGDLALRLARTLLEHEERRVLVRRETRRLVGAEGALLREHPQPLEQEGARVDELAR